MCHARERTGELFVRDIMWCGDGLCELLPSKRVGHERLVRAPSSADEIAEFILDVEDHLAVAIPPVLP